MMEIMMGSLQRGEYNYVKRVRKMVLVDLHDLTEPFIYMRDVEEI